MPFFPIARSTLRLLVTTLVTSVLAGSAPVVLAQPVSAADAIVLDAREALRKRDRDRLAADRAAAVVGRHPLASWVDYWELSNRLSEAQQPELEAFYARWPNTYVEDRLRNDWLLELGHRRDWANFTREFPRFRMNDDREVTCYALLTEHLAGRDVTQQAKAAWRAQRDVDEGCNLLATTMVEAGRFTVDDVWRTARLAMELNRLRVVRFAAGLVSPQAAAAVGELIDEPARYLTRKASVMGRTQSELTALAVMRMAWNDPGAAAGQLEQRWQHALSAELAGNTWAVVAKQAAFKLMPEAVPYYQAAWKAGHKRGATSIDWTDDALAWGVRSALRSARGSDRWLQVRQMIGAMSPAERKDPAWVYWEARAIAALALPGAEGDAARAQSRQLLESIASPLSFYGLLAAEDIGLPLALPDKPTALMPEEEARAQQHPGLQRALLLINIGLRNEGVREWNFWLRGMSDRELLAAAQVACDREVWDRCINTSDRTREEVDIEQRFPTPFRNDLLAKAREMGIDPAYVYGLIRQESRFVTDARSSVGASGLMQVMPTTARWTAKKLGMPFSPEMITDRDTNLRIGTGYLKLVLDDFGGSQALAAAAYNAGPTRPRRWREGPVLEPAIWAENVPFNETRDYVKKVLANAALYAAVLTGQPPSLKARLGPPIGPRDATIPEPVPDLP
ncbi:lytic transglycosylase domain-containing protein [Ideonella sp. BN130291]|uniref:lytic transglycosylase domain-containing protein n=1 Tax=Ideonella sp. BN130291 TaxID=3112940 RepID=UPI002E26AABC|nr:transglycosylase SLT domain-containing protein [Ideonella sp. BN130291]